ncbi:MAG: hypothetical protein ACYTX0_58210, partial [Nostoc sp.]
MQTNNKSNPSDSPQVSCQTHRQNILPTAPLPESISQNIETIIALHRRYEKDVPQHQRVVETVTAFFGRPAFLYSILLGIILWVTPNVLPRRLA